MTAGRALSGRPTDGEIRAYLEGEHGPPSAEAVAIVQAELEHAIRTPLPLHRTEANYGITCSTCDGGGCLDCTDPA